MTVLVLTDTGDLAADLVVLELQRRAIRYCRLNIDNFPAHLQIVYDPVNSSAIFFPDGEQFSSHDVSVAWYRRSRQFTYEDSYIQREISVFLQCLWREMTWPWVNDPIAVDRANSKLWQLRIASEIGFDIPDTLIGNQRNSVEGRLKPGPVIAKTLGGAAIERYGKRYDLFSQLIPLSELETAAVGAAPCIFQEQVKPGTDVRVTVVGEHVFATDIDAPANYADWRAAPREAVTYCPIDLPAELVKRCRELCRTAGLIYGAFDFVRQPGDRYVFLEVNPSGQWGWIEHATGQRITEAIVDVLIGHQGGTDARRPRIHS
jgi:glutathione synthase/RimK-type ligase-like ATP-grasp enzyme